MPLVKPFEDSRNHICSDDRTEELESCSGLVVKLCGQEGLGSFLYDAFVFKL